MPDLLQQLLPPHPCCHKGPLGCYLQVLSQNAEGKQPKSLVRMATGKIKSNVLLSSLEIGGYQF